MRCPLCESSSTHEFHAKQKSHIYYKCSECQLIFLSPKAHLSEQDERARYDQHQNNPDNAGYVASLMKLVKPLSARLKPGAHGLDFGCGPQSVLKQLFEKQGHFMEVYDPFFFPDEAKLRQTYDFVACTEVVEHFRHPKKEFVLLDKLVKSRGGRLGIMTQLVETERDFADWWYHRDPTHVCFYRKETLQWIADHRRWTLEIPDKNVAIFVK